MKKKVKHPGVRPHGATESDQTEETCIPSFLAIVSIYAASMHEYQSFDHVLKVRSLTCAIAECPVLGEQFTELCFAAFKMISHLGNGYV